MLIGYARVSTEDQLLDLQRAALIKAGVAPDRIYEEHVSGVKTHRPRLAECLRACREGDVLTVWRLDRLGRSTIDLIKITEELRTRGIGFHSLTEHLDTTTAAGKLIFHVLAAFAEFERNLLSERTRAGLKAARARGHRGGRKPKVTAAMMKAARAMLADPTVVMQEVADTLKVSRSAIYRAFERSKEADKMKALRKAQKVAKRTSRPAIE